MYFDRAAEGEESQGWRGFAVLALFIVENARKSSDRGRGRRRRGRLPCMQRERKRKRVAT